MPLSGSTDNPMGSISYNGITITGPTTRVTGKMIPEKDSAGRTVVGNRFELSVRAILTDDITNWNTQSGSKPATQQSMEKLRTLLARPGGELIIDGFGLDMTINNQTAPIDLDWGPWTTSFEWKHLGGGIAYEIVWNVTFMIAECWNGSSVSNPGVIGGTNNQALKSLTFTVAYSINDVGLTTRTVEGQFEILLHRSSVANGGASNEIPTTADQYRDVIRPEVPLGFKRSESTFVIDEAKDTCRFRISDTQIPSQYAPPPGVVSIEMVHAVEVANNVAIGAAQRIDNVISGSFEVAFNASMASAWNNVLLVVQDRIEKGRQSLPVDRRAKDLIITSVRITEALFGPRRVTFEWTYYINLAANQGLNVTGRSGMFSSRSGSAVFSWTAHRDSFEQAWSQRGLAGLEFQPDQDKIVSLCDNATGTDLSDSINETPVGANGGSLTNDCAQLSGQYTVWDVDMEFYSYQFSHRHICMRSADDPPEPERYITGDGAPIAMIPSASENYQRVQSSEQMIKVTIKGRAERIKRKVEQPDIFEEEDFAKGIYESTSSLKITGFQSRFANKQSKVLGGCTTFLGEWKISFDISGPGNELNTFIDLLESKLWATPQDPEGKNKFREEED
jgi:hypothetical protein